MPAFGTVVADDGKGVPMKCIIGEMRLLLRAVWLVSPKQEERRVSRDLESSSLGTA
jgi:hypothetical protein